MRTSRRLEMDEVELVQVRRGALLNEKGEQIPLASRIFVRSGCQGGSNARPALPKNRGEGTALEVPAPIGPAFQSAALGSFSESGLGLFPVFAFDDVLFLLLGVIPLTRYHLVESIHMFLNDIRGAKLDKQVGA